MSGSAFLQARSLHEAGAIAEAERICEEILLDRPDHFDALRLLGAIAVQSGRPALAIRLARQAIALRPAAADAYGTLADALHQLGHSAQALDCYDKALALAPDFAAAWSNRAAVLRDLGRPEAALASCDRAIAARPDLMEAHANRGNALRDLGRPREALAAFDAALALRPDDVELHCNKSMCLLAMGDYAQGWEMYEWRWRSWWARPRQEGPGTSWSAGIPIDGKTILVHAEQGFGDTLQFCRYIPALAARAAVVLEVPRPLARLMATLRGVSRIVVAGDAPPPFDISLPMMSLPLALRDSVPDIPAEVPYLHEDADRAAVWRERLAAFPGRKIGLAWSGDPRRDVPRNAIVDRRRSMALACFAPLAAVPDVCLVSLQKGDGAAQARTPPAGMVLHDWTAELDDFADTAALAAALDLVISVDTSVVHLAGALGKPVWVLNRYDQCWRWLHDRSDSPWYPAALLFRQPAPGDWDSVIGAVAAALLSG